MKLWEASLDFNPMTTGFPTTSVDKLGHNIGHIRADQWLRRIEERFQAVASQEPPLCLADSPYPMFPSLLAGIGPADTLFVQTLRPARDWAKDRRKKHGKTMFCKPEFTAGSSADPLDDIACARACGQRMVHECTEYIHDMELHEIAVGYEASQVHWRSLLREHRRTVVTIDMFSKGDQRMPQSEMIAAIEAGLREAKANAHRAILNDE